MPPNPPSSNTPESGQAPGPSAPVTLYYFEGYDFAADKVLRSNRPATLGFIERYHFQPVRDNTMEVDSSQVDAQGLLASDS